MTPDKTPSPTDAEAWALWTSLPLTGSAIQSQGEFARAVLAKWGSPVVAGEPFCYVSVNKQGDITRTIKRKDRWTNIPLYTTPQPTQAQAGAVPLTDEQIGSMACVYGLTNIEVPALQWLVREVEYLHGIKEGGQHAAD